MTRQKEKEKQIEKEIIRIEISVPDRWNKLDQEQLRFFFIMLDKEDSIEDVISRCFLKWSGIKVIGKNKSKNSFLLKKDDQFFSASSLQVYQWSRALAFLESMPTLPKPLRSYGKHKSVDPFFKDVSFGTYLSCVAIWSELMKSSTLDDDKLRQLISHLYGFKPKRIKPEFAGCVVFWMSSIQDYFSKKFKDLFAPVSSDGQGSLGSASSSFQDSMNAMIRALTKGDVLKEKDVLNVDVWRALTELNAQAKEARNINESIKRK